MKALKARRWDVAIARMRAGVDSNVDIARDLGVSRERVRQIRAKLGIAPVVTQVIFAITQAGGRVGSAADSSIATEIGVSASTIRSARKRLGIPAHRRQSAHGTRNRYAAGCRCAACAKANRVYSRATMARIRRSAGIAASTRRCAICQQVGHFRTTCPEVTA